MFTHLDEKSLALLKDETKALAFLATIMKNGFPQLTPIWFDMDGDVLQLNTAEGRAKDHNMKVRPHVTVLIMKLDTSDYYLQLQGEVESRTTEGGVAHINSLSHKYSGVNWVTPAGQVRVKYRIKINKVIDGS